ncbi:transposase [Luteibacter anthropi]|uniref:Transposase n=1 Tax=Luteibacter anthropi TaxID=564369 RepID=A0A7X5UC19_9GAMM|nr:transposase [Luteibacter anthropi]
MWEELRAWIPELKTAAREHRTRIPDRRAFDGILIVLYIRIPWEDLPKRARFRNGMICWCRRHEWQARRPPRFEFYAATIWG